MQCRIEVQVKKVATQKQKYQLKSYFVLFFKLPNGSYNIKKVSILF